MVPVIASGDQRLMRYGRFAGGHVYSDSVLGTNGEVIHRWDQRPCESLLWAATYRWVLHIGDPSLGSHISWGVYLDDSLLGSHLS